jgi:hypothetical protein
MALLLPMIQIVIEGALEVGNDPIGRLPRF